MWYASVQHVPRDNDDRDRARERMREKRALVWRDLR